jgi:hypothetical protein
MDDSDDEELDSGSLHLSDLDQSESSQLDLSAISHDPEDEHEILEEIHELEPPEDTMINASSQNKSAFTDPESFRTISQFPLTQSNISSLSLSGLNSSADTTKDESSFDGGKRRRKSRKHKKTKKTNKSKKVKKNKITKKSKKTKTKRRRSAKLRRNKRLRGGFIGDNGRDVESYGGTNPYSMERDADSRF